MKLPFFRRKERVPEFKDTLPPLDTLGDKPIRGFEEPLPTPSSYPAPQQFFSPPGQPAFPAGPSSMDKDFQIIASKLDSIRAQLDLVNARLARLEQIAEEANKQRPGW